MDHIQLFYNNEPQREAVKQYFLEVLNQQALKKVFEQKDTKSIAEAKEVIEVAFGNMNEAYGKKLPISPGARR